MENQTEKQLWNRLANIHRRVNKLAELEAEAAKKGGLAADGSFIAEKLHLCDEADDILDRLEAGLFDA